MEIIGEVFIKLKLVVLVRFGERERRGCFGKEKSHFFFIKGPWDSCVKRKRKKKKINQRKKEGKRKKKKKEFFFLKP